MISISYANYLYHSRDLSLLLCIFTFFALLFRLMLALAHDLNVHFNQNQPKNKFIVGQSIW